MGDRADLVGGIPLFATLTEAQRGTVERLFFPVQRSDGETIVAEGDESAVNFYVLTSGEAVVSMHGREINRLQPGDFFGEVALTTRTPRSATVTARGSVELLAISGWNFSQLLATDGEIREALQQAAAECAERDAQRTW